MENERNTRQQVLETSRDEDEEEGGDGRSEKENGECEIDRRRETSQKTWEAEPVELEP